MTHRVLLLNADTRPVSWLPISTISWQNSVRLIWLDAVEVLHTYDNWLVHSPSTTIEVPAVVTLRKQVQGFKSWKARDELPQAHLVFLRDMFICQYCNTTFPRRQLTIDHVTPKSLGGRTTWKNVTSACSPCNGKRGSNYRIRPINDPYLPTLSQLIKNMRKFQINVPHVSWNYYLNWAPELVRLKNDIILNDDFDIDNNMSVECLLL